MAIHTPDSKISEAVNYNTLIHSDAMKELIRAALQGKLNKRQFFLGAHLIREYGDQMEGVSLKDLLHIANRFNRMENIGNAKKPK